MLQWAVTLTAYWVSDSISHSCYYTFITPAIRPCSLIFLYFFSYFFPSLLPLSPPVCFSPPVSSLHFSYLIFISYFLVFSFTFSSLFFPLLYSTLFLFCSLFSSLFYFFSSFLSSTSFLSSFSLLFPSLLSLLR